MGSFDWGELAKSAPKGFEPVPKGEYTIEVTDSEAKTYSTGNQGVQIEVTIEDAGPAKGKKIKFTNIVFNPENPGTFFGQLRALGIGPEFFAEYGKIDEDDEEALGEIMEDIADEVIGKRAIAPVTQRTYEGRTNNQVGFFKPLGAGGSKRRSRGNTPDVEPETKPSRRSAPAPDPEPADESGDAPESGDGEGEPEAPRRGRTGRSRRSGAEPGLPPGL